jgi:hypothetical protein
MNKNTTINKDVAKEIFCHVKRHITKNYPNIPMDLSGYKDFHLHCVNNLECEVIEVVCDKYIKFKKLNCNQSNISFDAVYESYVAKLGMKGSESKSIRITKNIHFKLKEIHITILLILFCILLYCMLWFL